MSDDGRYFNREFSWLAFMRRVLALAKSDDVPLLERTKFVAIVSDILDEFFQVRVAGLEEQVAAGIHGTSLDGISAIDQLATIRLLVDDLYKVQGKLVRKKLLPMLEEIGVRIALWKTLSPKDRDHLDRVFRQELFPVLTPLAVDPAHPFPNISSLSLNLAVVVRDPETGSERFARVKVPPILPRFIRLPDGERFVPLEQVIGAHLEDLFPGMDIMHRHPFRLTRNADFEIAEDEAEDLLEAIQSELGRRRFGRTVRLEVERSIDPDVLTLLVRELGIEERQVYRISGLLGLGSLVAFDEIDKPDHKWEYFSPVIPPRLAAQDGSIFDVIAQGDVFVHHPYESFPASTAEFINQAAADPQVLAIKQTLYRTSADSSVARALIRAAESGKQVVALIELKARFDEERNIEWARTFEDAGVHVVYGLVGLKTHAKTALVVRQEKDRIVRYVHVATGNYNEHTARLYEDVGVFTMDEDIGADVGDLFNRLTGYSRQKSYRKLIVAPAEFRDRMMELIRQEAEFDDGHIVAKMNALVDAEIIEALYAASGAGTRIDLIVRGICCLRPGVEGMSDNITVRSIVGRFLEHSRIYRFGRPERGFRYYLGSGDLMPRNLDRRVEVLMPVEDEILQGRLEEILDLCRADDHLSWILQSDGSYARRRSKNDVDLHQTLIDRTVERARIQQER